MSNWGYKNLTRDPRLTRVNLGQGNGLVFRISVREFFGHTKDKQPSLSGVVAGGSALVSRVQHSTWKYHNLTRDPRLIRSNICQNNGVVSRLCTEQFFSVIADKQPALSGVVAGGSAVISRVQHSKWKYHNLTKDGRLTRENMDKASGLSIICISRGEFFGTVNKIVVGAGGLSASGGADAALDLNVSGVGGALASGQAAYHKDLRASSAGGATVAGSAAMRLAMVIRGSGGVSASGQAAYHKDLRASSAGGATVAGSAAMRLAMVIRGSGGALASGSAAAHLAISASAHGGVVASGAAICIVGHSAVHLSWLGTGGAVVGGAADVRLLARPSISGGAVASGSASSHFDLSAVGNGGPQASSSALLNVSVTWIVSGGPSADGSALLTKALGLVGTGGAMIGGSAIFVKGYTPVAEPGYQLVAIERDLHIATVSRELYILSMPRVVELAASVMDRTITAKTLIREVAA